MKGRRSLNHAKVIASINTENDNDSLTKEYSEFVANKKMMHL